MGLQRPCHLASTLQAQQLWCQVGTRESVRTVAAPGAFEPKAKRKGKVSEAERALVAQFVADQPAAITTAQVAALAKLTRRSKEVIQGLIADAREGFLAAAPRYAEIHKQATEAALAAGSVGGLEVALKGSQWALERATYDGMGVIEKAKGGGGDSGPRILIGIRVGAVDNPNTVIPISVTPMVVPDE